VPTIEAAQMDDIKKPYHRHPMRMFRRTTALGWIAAVLLLGSCSASRHAQAPERAFHLIGYVHGDRMLDPLQAARLTHVNYAFAVLKEGRVVLPDPAPLAQVPAWKKANPVLKVLLSIGGWDGSGGFSDAALSDSSREVFAQSAIDIVRTHALDGLDIDWEYPGLPGKGNPHRPDDRRHFTLLLQTLRTHLDALGERVGHTYLLTIAAGAGPNYLAHTEIEDVYPYVDFINLMTYDFNGSWSDSTGHLTNLYGPEDASSAASAVEAYEQRGVPARKLVLGAAFYGKAWTGVHPANHGLHQPYDGAVRDYAYHTIASEYIDRNGFTRYWDPSARAPYLWNPDSTVFISYENTRSLREKARFVRDKDLGGIMFWEIGQDPSGTLVKALFEGLHPRINR